ncbi:MAG: DipZ protein [Solirubrobacteraceae bacterium]
MRAPAETIPAPPFPRPATWINVAMLRMDQQVGRPVLIEFWDFCRPASVRSVAYLQAWHERYAEHGLRVVGAHWPGFACSRGVDAVEAAVERLGLTFPVLLDDDGEYRDDFEAPGWPSRYLFDGSSWLVDHHVGEGGYRECEEAILELLGRHDEPIAPLRPVDDDDAMIVIPTPEHEGPFSGAYRAGEVWVVAEPTGADPVTVLVDGDTMTLDGTGAFRVRGHDRSTTGEITVEPGPGTVVHGVSFAPGLAPEGATESLPGHG